MQEAHNPFIQALFVGPGEGPPQHSTRGKLSFISVASKFKTQLQELMDKLSGTVGVFFLINLFLFYFVDLFCFHFNH